MDICARIPSANAPARGDLRAAVAPFGSEMPHLTGGGGEQHPSELKRRNLIVKEKNEQQHKDGACEGNLGKRSARCLKGKRGHDCK